MSSRPLRVAHFALDEQWLYVSDEAFPVVAQLDRRTGRVEQVVWWDPSDQHRGRSASSGLLPRGDDLWVSAPSAGGPVRIELANRRSTLIPLDEEPGPIAAVGDTIWVVADPNWAATDDGAPAAPTVEVPRRPVVWEGPPDPEVDEDEDENEDFSWDAPRPVWRVAGGAAERVDLGGDVYQLVPLRADDFVIAMRRNDDPVVKTREGEGSVGYGYPGVLALGDRRATPTALVELPETGGRLFVDGERVWLSGFGFEDALARPGSTNLFDPDPNALQALDVETGLLTVSPFTLDVVAIVDNIAVVIEEQHASAFGGRTTRAEAHFYDLADPVAAVRVELSRAVDTYNDAVESHGTVWFPAEDAPVLVWVDPKAGTTGEIAIDIDLGASAPAPTRPAGVDLEAFEQSTFAALRDSLTGGWVDEAGNETPFIRGVEITAVELRGQFPDSHIVARLTAADRPGIAFARRWNLYDDLGNTEDLEYADIHLMEHIEAAGWGLPPSEECHPDPEGLVWF